MAHAAQQEARKRVSLVNRLELLTKLATNREQHQKDYAEALSVYTNKVREAVNAEYAEAKKRLDEGLEKILKKLDNLEQKDIKKQTSHWTLAHTSSVVLPVPVSYDKDYKDAIELLQWETREVVELSAAEFKCFVQDEWDWANEFANNTKMYSSAR